MQTTQNDINDKVWEALKEVTDPEIPVLTLIDLGVIKSVDINANDVKVVMIPTFVGCPAIDHMKNEIKTSLEKVEEVQNVEVEVDMQGSWHSDMMTEKGREKLHKFGIAPPPKLEGKEISLESMNNMRCPHCGSTDTSLNTPFGTTLCRAISICYNCRQSFEQFKPI